MIVRYDGSMTTRLTFVVSLVLAMSCGCSLARSAIAGANGDDLGTGLDGGFIDTGSPGNDAYSAGHDAHGSGNDAYVGGTDAYSPGNDAYVAPDDANMAPDAGSTTLRTCDATYSSAGGYQLCTETATACSFYATVNFITCAGVCGAFGGSCLSASTYENAGHHCNSNGPLSCFSPAYADAICTCSRIP
jgi:hypothetical protein